MTRQQTFFSNGCVTVVGIGYVGLPLSMTAHSQGLVVSAVDTNLQKVAQLNAGKSYIEDVGDDAVRQAIRSGTFAVNNTVGTTSSGHTFIITVPTPAVAGVPELGSLKEAARAVGSSLQPNSLVIIESTTYPGCTEELIAPILEDESGMSAGEEFFLAYSPERVNPGDKQWTINNTPKLIAGVNTSSSDACFSFYDMLGIPTHKVSTIRNAEFTKLLENAFRMVNISLINELQMSSRDIDIDIWECIEAASTKPYGFMAFTPGPGVGGHCLPVDTQYLSWILDRDANHSSAILDATNTVNARMADFWLAKVEEKLLENGKEMQESRVVLLGLAYKGGIGDTRESPAIALNELLKSRGVSTCAIDPFVLGDAWPSNIEKAEGNELGGWDLAVLITAHPGTDWFSEVTEVAIPILDTRGHLRLQ